MSEHTPKHGLRVLLELSGGEVGGARYRVELHVPSASHAADASVDANGVTFGAWAALEGEAAEPEEWTVDAAKAFLRVLQKNHAAEGDWPVRVFRWRERR